MYDEGSIFRDDAEEMHALAMAHVDAMTTEQYRRALYWLAGYAPASILRLCEVYGWVLEDEELGSVADGL
jgi:hypothetical protein